MSKENTQFKKGQASWNKGKKMSEETKQKVSNAKKGSTPWNKGKTGIYSDEQIQKLRKSSIDRKVIPPSFLGKHHSEETKKRMSISGKGKIISEETKKKQSGENNHRWIKDRTLVKGIENRKCSEYSNWRKQVKDRDNWKCRLCSNECSGRLEVHHIYSFTHYPELRYLLTNGITLCKYHHPLKKEEEIRMIPIFQELILNTQ